MPEIFRNGVFLNPNNVSSGQQIAARAFVAFGLTESSQDVDYVRGGGGLRGDFFLPDWRYNAYVGKSWTDGQYEIESFLVDRVANSMLVTQNADGTFRCQNQATFATCVAAPPLNAATIGGNLPQNFRDYILQNTIGTTKFRETTFSFAVDGPLFQLPGGAAQLALGAEYRKQKIDDTPDLEAQRGNLLGLTASLPTRGTDNVKEVFGEIFLPLLSKRPFFENVVLNASARYTDYESYGSDVTYKAAGEWEFFRGFGIRASYGTSYRAPALAEQFLGATSGFLASNSDPCDADNFPANGNFNAIQQQIAANCAKVGLDVRTFQQNNGITIFNRGGRETGLVAETSTNWSVGAVVQPRLPAAFGTLSLALDYFDIEVKNGVSSLTGATILNRCFIDPGFSATGGFCRFVTRDANNILTVTSGFVNLATDVRKGFEFTGRYARDLFGGRFVFNANITKYTEQSNLLFAEEFALDSNGTLNTPDWVGTFDATYRTGPATLRYGVSWLDASTGTDRLACFNRATGQPTPSCLTSVENSFKLERDDYFLHTASVQLALAENFEFTFGVRNLLDRDPPRISAGVFNVRGNAPLSSNYDYTGRQFFVNTTFSF